MNFFLFFISVFLLVLKIKPSVSVSSLQECLQQLQITQQLPQPPKITIGGVYTGDMYGRKKRALTPVETCEILYPHLKNKNAQTLPSYDECKKFAISVIQTISPLNQANIVFGGFYTGDMYGKRKRDTTEALCRGTFPLLFQQNSFNFNFNTNNNVPSANSQQKVVPPLEECNKYVKGVIQIYSPFNSPNQPSTPPNAQNQPSTSSSNPLNVPNQPNIILGGVYTGDMYGKRKRDTTEALCREAYPLIFGLKP